MYKNNMDGLYVTNYFELVATMGCIAMCYKSKCNVALQATWLPHLA